MLSYQEDRKLEDLLEELFSDDDELTSNGVAVLGWAIGPIFSPFRACCRYNYTSYGG